MNLNNELSILTQVPVNILDKLSNTSKKCILHNIHQCCLEGNDCLEVDIVYGKILFYIDDENIVYRFIPSKDFEKSIINTIESQEDPLILDIEQSLKKKILNVYKELI